VTSFVGFAKKIAWQERVQPRSHSISICLQQTTAQPQTDTKHGPVNTKQLLQAAACSPRSHPTCHVGSMQTTEACRSTSDSLHQQHNVGQHMTAAFW
jgi:hypothetical protein